MRARLVVAIAVALGTATLVAVPLGLAEQRERSVTSPAIADAGRAAADSGAKAKLGPAGARRDPDNVTALSEFMVSCVEGNGKYLARDYVGAIDSYRRAIQLAPRNPLAHYLLGAAQLATGNQVEAEAAWKQAESLADNRDPLLRAKVLFVLADLKERQRKLPEARDAWLSYQEWVTKEVDGGTLRLSAPSRLHAIEEMIKLDKAYELVRERISAERVAGFDAGKK